jgi:hypothetical protein
MGTLTEQERLEIELEEHIRRKELTPSEVSKELVRKAEKIAPVLPSAVVGKKPRGEKRTYAAPKEDVAAALGVGKGTLVNAEQHVAAAKYPELAAPGSTESVYHFGTDSIHHKPRQNILALRHFW